MVEGSLDASTFRVKIVQTSDPQLHLLSLLKWNSEGLVPAIVQDAESGEVLMMAWMNSQALATTLDTGQTHFYSRSRKSLWHKGGTSGHVQLVELDPRGLRCGRASDQGAPEGRGVPRGLSLVFLQAR